MTVGQKASASLLIAVLLFAAFAVAAFSGLFDLFESSFRNPSIVRGIEASLAKVADAEAAFNASNLARFGAVLEQDSVRRSFLPNLSSQDAFDRANLFGKLQEETAGLSGVRLIDANGKRLHFSTIPGDILSKSQLETVFRNYGAAGDPPYESISAPEGSKGLVRIDPDAGGFVYSLPFSDSYGIYRGSAVFQVSLEALASLLARNGLVPIGENAVPADAGGLLFRVPEVYRSTLPQRAAGLWASGLGDKPITIATSVGNAANGAATVAAGESYVLFSRIVEGAGRVGYIVPASDFALPTAMKWILLASFFVTAYLLAFLLFNIRQDRMTVLSDRIKRFQINLLEEYVENKSDLDFGRWQRELEARRPEVRKAIRSGIGALRKNRQADVDELIDKSWDEILAVLGGRAGGDISTGERGAIGLKEIERLLGEALKSGTFVLPASTQVGPSTKGAEQKKTSKGPIPEQSPTPPAPVEAEEQVEELEELEELEPQLAESEPVQSVSLQSPAPPAPVEAEEQVEELENRGTRGTRTAARGKRARTTSFPAVSGAPGAGRGRGTSRRTRRTRGTRGTRTAARGKRARTISFPAVSGAPGAGRGRGTSRRTRRTRGTRTAARGKRARTINSLAVSVATDWRFATSLRSLCRRIPRASGVG